VPEAELVALVDALGASTVETVAFRHVSVGTNPRSGTGARIHGGRWNPPNSFATLYLALDRETVIAEFERAAQRQGLTPNQFLPRELHEFKVRLSAVLDLTTAEAWQQLQLDEAELKSDDPIRCREIGEAAHYVGLEAVMAPSSAGPGIVLAVFLERLQPGSAIEPLRHETWERP
jgi:RES domain-containing protein